ncbi:MAG: DUF4129 domain-containing protein [Chloroflexota bacterium]|nr:DUF4129 domain-containing protein [Chloroflexota bacterium]
MLAPPVAAVAAEEDTRIFTVREIYQGLLWEGRRVGLPRREPETPYEYQDKLVGRLEGVTPELRAITRAYVEERYGGARIPAEELRLVNRLWRRLRSALWGDSGHDGARPGAVLS